MLTGLATASSATTTVTISLATSAPGGGKRPLLWVAGGGASAGTITINYAGSVIFQVPFAANGGDLIPFVAPLNTLASATASVVVAGGNPSYAAVGYTYV
jgi:hypothetical protein